MATLINNNIASKLNLNNRGGQEVKIYLYVEIQICQQY